MSWLRSHHKKLPLLFGLFLVASMFVPQSAFACLAPTAGLINGGNIQYVSCSELADAGGAGSITTPTGTASGDTLILTIITDGGATVSSGPTTTNVTWTLINSGGDSTNTFVYRIYGGNVTGAPGGTTALTMSGTTDWQATIGRFTGATGWDTIQVTQGASASTNTPAPAVTTTVDNALILRMGGFDDDTYANKDDAAAMTSHTTISQFETPDALNSQAVVYINQPTAGTQAAQDFATIPTGNELWRTASLALLPYYMCTGTNTTYSTGPVHFAGCAEVGTYGNTATSITIPKPAGTANGDVLLAALTIDGNATAGLSAPSGWTELNEGVDNIPASTTAVYWRYADASTSYTFTWGGAGEEAFGYIMRFTGAAGGVSNIQTSPTPLTGTGTNVTTADITPTVANSAIVRMAGFDNSLIRLKQTTLMTGYNNITMGRSSGDTTDSVSGGATWANQITAGVASGTTAFTASPSGAEDTRRVTVALHPYRMCTGTNGVASGGVIEYQGCEQVTTNNTTSVVVPTPSATAIGDYIVAVLALDETSTITPPAGWNTIDSATDANTTLAVYGRFADTAGAQNHSFTLGTAQDAYAYIMRFTNVGAAFNALDKASANGTGTTATAPSFNTSVADTMVVRVGAFDNGLVTINGETPPTVIASHNNVTQGRSTANPANAVSSSAAWVNQPGIGATNTAVFGSAPGASEEWRALTFGLRPQAAHFRISFSSSSITTCGFTDVTIGAYTAAGALDSGYTGTIQLSTSNASGGWGVVTASGTLLTGPGDGTASYTFVGGDNGDVVLRFFNGTAGTVSINVADGPRVEHPGVDPSLTITACPTTYTFVRQTCESDASVDIIISPSSTNLNRLIVVGVGRTGGLSGSGTPPATPAGSQVVNPGSLQLTQVGSTAFNNNVNNDTMSQMYMMSDTGGTVLPSAGGTITVSVTNLGTMRTCANYYERAPQTAPTGSATNVTNTISSSTTIATVVTTPAANSLLFSVATGRTATLYTAAPTVTPANTGTSRLFTTNPAAGTTAFGMGFATVASASQVTTFTDTSVAATTSRAHVVAAFTPAPPALDHFRISHAGSGGICGPNNVTITAYDQFGNVFTGYGGIVNLSSGGSGTWSAGTVTPTNTTPGAATYDFTGAENGTITVGYTRTTTGTVDFNVSDSVLTTIDENDGFDQKMVMQACKFRFTHSATGNICSSTAVTLSVYMPDNATLATDYAGTVTLSTDLTPGAGGTTGQGGTWTNGDNLGMLTDSGSGNATIAITDNDNGNVVLNFQRTSTGTIDFNASEGSNTEDLSNDTTYTIATCKFRISFDGGGAVGDVCTPEAVTFTVVDNSGTTVTSYKGTMNVNTASNIGDWSHATAINPQFVNNGSGDASYDFDGTENGVVTLNLRYHAVSATVDIDVEDGFTEDDTGVSSTYDPRLNVSACKFRISLSPPNATTCTTTTVTVGVYNSAGTLATDYQGQATLSTDSGNGSWIAETGAGSLALSNETNGTDTYTFVSGGSGDQGDVALVFTHNTIATVNFNITSVTSPGAITVDTFVDVENDIDYDPDLKVTACLPVFKQVACYANNNQASAITLSSSFDTQASRVVLMYVNSNTTTAASAATIGGQSMTHLRTETVDSAADTTIDVFWIPDASLPSTAGGVTATFSGGGAGAAMCIVSLEGAAQGQPATNGTPSLGQLNGTNAADVTNGVNLISTSVTTNQNNSIVLSVVANPLGGSTYTSTQSTEMWNGGAVDATGADWAGFRSNQLVANGVTVVNDPDPNPNQQAQIVVAIGPKVIGAPAQIGYVPVTLYETFAGNVNYRTTGNTLRMFDNTTAACFMLADPNDYSDATINLPASSTIEAAYLYWAGSGFDADKDMQVSFGLASGALNTINADETFIIDGDQVYNQSYPAVAAGFFAGFADVTGYVTNATSATYRFADLAVQTVDPWFSTDSCVGGWALVVVYDNANENLNVINLFHGFQPFWHSSFRLVPRNFRMATPNDPSNIPNGQITHVTFEGDADPVALSGVDEVFELQNDPLAMTFDKLINGASNPADNQYNSTVQVANYTGTTFTGYTVNNQSWGTDVDTYYLEGDTNTAGKILYPFGNFEAEQITTEYSTGQDIVLLVGEFIAVTNAPIADLEMFVTDSGTFKVNSSGTSSYIYEVTNNGNGASTGGFASGDVILTGNMPSGITINSITFEDGNSWDCVLQTATAFTCVFEINSDANADASVAGQLQDGESLPQVTVSVNVGSEDTFPSPTNSVVSIGRIGFVGDYYQAACNAQPSTPAGVQPNPNPSGGCSKSPQFDNKNDLNKYLTDIDTLTTKSATNNNVDRNTRNVTGYVTDLQMTKSVVGVLQAGSTATYTLSVKNNGPDATTKTITVNDTLPAGVVPTSASGTDWTCPAPSGQVVQCTRTTSLASGATAPAITLNVNVTGSEGASITNNASVSVGAGNTDTTAGNNTEGDTTVITGAVAAATEKFLLSVTTDGSTVGTGSLATNRGDIVLYDPTTQSATMFLDEDDIPDTGPATNLGNIDAMHLLKNGQILMSTATDGAVIAGVTFNAEDIVLYDPILKTATLIFDGSAIFSVDTVNVDAIFVKPNNSSTISNWDVLLSTSADATIGGLTFQNNDIVSYDMGVGGFGAGGTATLLVDGAHAAMFGNATGDVAGIYLRYDNANKYILTTNSASATIGTNVPAETISYERGEIIEIDLTSLSAPVTTGLLCDSVIPCTATPALVVSNPIDAFHVVESGYFGHFSITSSGGDACSATAITIAKHSALTHSVDTTYTGSIRLSSNAGMGTWSKDVTAQGTIITSGYGLGAGEAIYTFAAADSGDAILYITNVNATNNFDANVSNGIGVEDATEDPDIIISDLVTSIEYHDEFGSAVYNNNETGYAAFSTNWSESADDASATTGNIRIAVDPNDSNSKLRFNNIGNTQPSIMRQVDFSAYNVEDPPTLAFNYRIAGNPSGSIIVEARDVNAAPSWVELQNFTASSGSGSASYTLTTALGIAMNAFTQLEFRFRIASGYNGNASQFFYVDSVVVATETHDCGAGNTVDHYSITAGDSSMVSCLAKEVTVTPHNLADVTVVPGAGIILTLNTSTNRGTWGKPTNGSGAFNAIPGTGQATYTYVAGEDDLVFPFYYTDLVADPEAVTFTVSDTNVPTQGNSLTETATLSASRTGFRFYNETDANENFPTLVAGMPSNLRKVLTLQAVKVSTNDPSVCEAAFPDNSDVQVQIGVECKNPSSCSAGTYPLVLTNNNTATNIEPVNDDSSSSPLSAGYQTVTLRFNNDNLGAGATSFSRAQLILNYKDVGEIQLHARRELQETNAGGVTLVGSGEYMTGISDAFVVRPFAFDMDFTDDRATNGNDDDATSWADDANDQVFFTAGSGFNTTVRAVLWECIDDDPTANCTTLTGTFDGVPADAADLYYNTMTMMGNATTPNFGFETQIMGNNLHDNVTVTRFVNAAMPMGSVAGTLTDNTFQTFANGIQTHTMTYAEVGIVDFRADLDNVNYLSGGEGVTGRIRNVGRFKPADFSVTLAALTDRALMTPSAAAFTYMGEQFGATFKLTARNTLGATTVNYLGSFAKLDTIGELSFFAIKDVTAGDDVTYTARLSKAATGPAQFPATFGSSWANGELTLTGNLILARNAGETAEAPLTTLQIALTAQDNDTVIDASRNVDDDTGSPDSGTALYNLIGTQDFRYGRIRLENGYGPEIADFYDHDNNVNTAEILYGRDLMVRLVAEYFDGSNFIANPDDIATPYNSTNLSLIDPDTMDGLLASEPTITSLSGKVYVGGTYATSGQTDTPFFLGAPGVGNEGQLLLQLDLDTPGLGYLKFDWRDANGDPFTSELNTDGVTDNPRSLIEFGTYRGNDRIINWQEIFL